MKTVTNAAKTDGPVVIAGQTITHPERVIDPASGATKLDLARYYATVAPLILPHLAQRPVALLRAPDGKPQWLQALAWAFGSAMAFSRVAVGAHWPADILVGAGLGLAVGALCWQLQARWLRQGGWMSAWVPLAVELLGALAAFTAREGYPQVQALQWALGLAALASAGWRLLAWRGQGRIRG